MREHPLLMKGPLVRATLAGLKTQTRRPVKMPSHGIEPYYPGYVDGALWNYSFREVIARCPMGQAGDRLWVRETWARPGDEEINCQFSEKNGSKCGAFGGLRTRRDGRGGYWYERLAACIAAEKEAGK